MLITSSVYSGLTNNNGICTFNFESIDEDTLFTASYEDLTATTTVELVLFYDKAVTGQKNTNWINSNISEVTTDTTGTLVKCDTVTSANTTYYGTDTVFTGDFCMGFDLKTTTPYNCSLGVRTSTDTNLLNKRSSALGVTSDTWTHLKFIRQGTIAKWYNEGTEVSSDTITTVDARFRFYNDAVNTFFVKNFVVYKK